MSYTVFAFDRNKIDLERIHTLLQTVVSEAEGFAGRPVLSLNEDGDEMVLDLDGWQIVMGVNSSDYVAAETRGLVEHLPADDKDKLATVRGSAERLEIISDEDYDEAHYEDYQLFIELLERITGMVVVDPREWNYS